MLPLNHSNESKLIDSILKEARIDKKAVEFPSQEAMDKYLKEHPDADKSNHKVVEIKKEEVKEPEEKKKSLNNYLNQNNYKTKSVEDGWSEIRNTSLGVDERSDAGLHEKIEILKKLKELGFETQFSGKHNNKIRFK